MHDDLFLLLPYQLPYSKPTSHFGSNEPFSYKKKNFLTILPNHGWVGTTRRCVGFTSYSMEEESCSLSLNMTLLTIGSKIERVIRVLTIVATLSTTSFTKNYYYNSTILEMYFQFVLLPLLHMCCLNNTCLWGANKITRATPTPLGDYLLGVYFGIFLEFF